MRALVAVTALLLSAGATSAHAADVVPAPLKARLSNLAPGMEPDDIRETPLAGIYEVRYGSIIVYLSGDGRYMLRGDLMDLETRRNFTEETRARARSIPCARRPLAGWARRT